MTSEHAIPPVNKSGGQEHEIILLDSVKVLRYDELPKGVQKHFDKGSCGAVYGRVSQIQQQYGLVLRVCQANVCSKPFLV